MQNPDSLSDEELMQLVAASGDKRRQALTELWRRWNRRLLNFIKEAIVQNFHDAEDVVQNVFHVLLSKGATYDASRRFRPWVLRIAHNQAVNFLREKGKHSAQPLDEECDQVECDSPEPIEELIRDEEELIRAGRNQRVQKAMSELPEHFRTVLYLKYFEHFTIEDIADIMGQNPSATQSLLHRARKALRRLLEDGENPETQTPEVKS
jgi:RNA polymerase sigma-70 factor (ECF subfamily)